MNGTALPLVLCVDDEPQVLEGIKLHLRHGYEVITVADGSRALDELLRRKSAAVIISDMRMPGMDGAAFLALAQQIAPHAVRLLLTGQADIDSAIAAVNDGQIFRFLTKPCPPMTLLTAVDAAAEQHRLIVAERVLLEQTLHGCLKALTDILALANPGSFGRALRIKRYVSEVAAKLALPDRWQLEVAAMVSQLGLITLPTDTVEKLRTGGTLSSEERQMVDRLPAVTAQLLESIPRLEGVRTILSTYAHPYRQIASGSETADFTIRRSAHILRIAIDFNDLEARGMSPARAIASMRERINCYDPAILERFALLRVDGGVTDQICEVALSALREGMLLVEDVKLPTGTLLVARGYEVTERFVERIRNFSPEVRRRTVRTVVRQVAAKVGT